MKIYFVCVLSMFILTSCVANIDMRKTDFNEMSHLYNVTIVDINKNPVKGAKVSYVLRNEGRIIKDTIIVTDDNAKISEIINATSKLGDGYARSYSTSFNYYISKKGYSSKSGFLSNNFGSRGYKGLPIMIEEIELYKFTDYFKADFLSDKKNDNLVAKIMNFMSTLKNQSQISDSILKWNSIFLSEFKENSYLSITFENQNVFNSIKLDKYDIGKRLFDEVVRKILNPLNDNLGDSELFFGYDITVIGYTKSFIDEYASNKKILYRFLIPNEIVKNYKNKDITGQHLLDQSVILMDDERIDLKLQ